MFIVVSKEDNLVQSACEEIIDNNDGSFTNPECDIVYNIGDFCYYELDDKDFPRRVFENFQYYYTIEDGFKLAYTGEDYARHIREGREYEYKSLKILQECQQQIKDVANLYDNFINKTTDIENRLSILENMIIELFENVAVTESNEEQEVEEIK